MSLLAEVGGGEPPGPHLGQGTCYIEFGGGRVGGVEIDFLSGPERTGVFRAPSTELVAEKEDFGAVRRARWFGA
jgi:sulfide:quinone oxidoreductase